MPSNSPLHYESTTSDARSFAQATTRRSEGRSQEEWSDDGSGLGDNSAEFTEHEQSFGSAVSIGREQMFADVQVSRESGGRGLRADLSRLAVEGDAMRGGIG